MKSIELPTSWSEVTTYKFKQIAPVFFDNLGKSDIRVLRVQLLKALTGLSFPEKKAGCTQYVAELTSFMFNLSHNNEVLALLSDNAKEALRFCHPLEIDNKDVLTEIDKLRGLLASSIDINFRLPQNPIPTIELKKLSFKGPIFNIEPNGIILPTLLPVSISMLATI